MNDYPNCPVCGHAARVNADVKLHGKREHAVILACGNNDCILYTERGGWKPETWAKRPREDALAAENARLRALVEQVEWVYTGETTWVCPWCNGEKYAGGHAADCPRQAALGEGR